MIPVALLLRIVTVVNRNLILLEIWFENLALILFVEIHHEKWMFEADEEVSLVARSFFLLMLFGTFLHNRLLLVLDGLYRPVAALVAAIDLLL